jgi:uncharacterized protein YrrD
MHYISARIRPAKVFHGYDQGGSLVTAPMSNEHFVEKVIKVERILSITEDYIFIQCPHDTVQNWEYEGSLETMKGRLRQAGLLID